MVPIVINKSLAVRWEMRIFKKKNSSIKGEFMGCYPSCGIKPRLWNRIRYEVENISKMTYFIVVFDWSRSSIALFGLKPPLTRGE